MKPPWMEWSSWEREREREDTGRKGGGVSKGRRKTGGDQGEIDKTQVGEDKNEKKEEKDCWKSKINRYKTGKLGSKRGEERKIYTRDGERKGRMRYEKRNRKG